MSLFFERFLELCREGNTSPNAVAKKLDISSGSVTAWKKGVYPRSETVNKLAEFFHVSADYLFGNVNEPFFYLDNKRILDELNSYGDEKENPAPSKGDRLSDSQLMFALWGDNTEITEDDLADVRRYAEFVAQRKKEKK